MNIQYYGDFCFKITTKPGGRATEDVVVWTDLPDKSTGIRTPFGVADVVLLSHTDPESDALSGLKGESHVFDVPGEYSVKGIAVLGLPSFRDAALGAERGQNTVFVFDTEEVRLAFLGAIGHKLDEKTIEKIGDPDVLFVPVGGDGTLPSKEVDELIREIEPKIVIPMHYAIPGTDVAAGTAEAFCKEIGCTMGDDVPKLNFKKKDLDGKSMEITFLSKT